MQASIESGALDDALLLDFVGEGWCGELSKLGVSHRDGESNLGPPPFELRRSDTLYVESLEMLRDTTDGQQKLQGPDKSGKRGGIGA